MKKSIYEFRNNPVVKLLEKHFPNDDEYIVKDGDITRIDHPCGCREFIEDPGPRGLTYPDHWMNCKNCFLHHEFNEDEE